MEERLTENDLGIVRDMEKLLTAETFSSISEMSISNIASFYNFNPDDLKAELRVFCNLVKDCEQSIHQKHIIQDRLKFFSEDSSLKIVLSFMSKLMKIFWTFPVSSCNAERSFSFLRHLKTYVGSTMGQDRLSALASLNIEREISIDIQKIVNLFAAESSRKLRLLY